MQVTALLNIAYMTKIIIDIKDCTHCPFFDSERVYTADSWESVYKWKCKKQHNKIISSYVEIFDKIPIPNWCPISDAKIKVHE